MLTFGFFVFALLAAYELAGYIVSGDLTSLAVFAMLCVGVAIVVTILNNWRRGLYFFLAWLLFEDFARKFLGNNMAIFFAKDFLIAVVYLSFFAAHRRKAKDIQIFRPPFLVPLLVLVWFGFVQIFNPASTSIVYGILGMKVYFYYLPMVVIGYAAVNSEVELRRFFYINLSLMLIIAALGIAQSILGPTFLSPAVSADDIALLSNSYRQAPISHVIVYRPTSVFVSTGRFADLLIVAWLLVFGFSGYLLLRHRRGRSFAFLALGVTAAACVMCAARGVFMWSMGNAIVGAVAFIWGAPWRQGQARRVFRTLLRAVFGIVLAMAALLTVYPDALLNRLAVYSETLDPRSPSSELFSRLIDYPLTNFLGALSSDRWLYGYGIGTISLGGQYVSRIFHVLPPTEPVESGFGAIIIEMGVGGLILWLVMSVTVAVCAWGVVRKLKGSPWFPLGFMIFWYAFILLLPFTFQGLQLYQDYVMNAYLWLLLGILFRLPKLALSAQFAADAPTRSARSSLAAPDHRPSAYPSPSLSSEGNR
jgi:hypothetical protein